MSTLLPSGNITEIYDTRKDLRVFEILHGYEPTCPSRFGILARWGYTYVGIHSVRVCEREFIMFWDVHPLRTTFMLRGTWYT